MKRYPILLATAGLLVATPSFGDSGATATLGPLTVELVDLDPTDGVLPSIDFGAPHVGATEGQVNAVAVVGNDVRRITEGWGAPFVPVGVGVASGTVAAYASIAGAGQAEGTVFAAEGSAGDFSGHASVVSIYEAQAWQTDPWGRSFLLSPHTQLLVSAPAWVAISGSGGPGQTNASATLYLSGRYQFVSSDSLGFVADPDDGQSFVFSDARLLSVSISNTADTEMNGYYTFSATVHGEVYASAVPEPGVFALTLAGIGGVVSAARRRRDISSGPARPRASDIHGAGSATG
jgi:hypothetical protein